MRLFTWSVSRSIGWLFVCLVNRLFAWSIGRSFGRSFVCLVVCLLSWSVVRLVGRLFAWLLVRLLARSVVFLVGCLLGRSVVCSVGHSCSPFIFLLTTDNSGADIVPRYDQEWKEFFGRGWN